MSETSSERTRSTKDDAADLVASTESGARSPAGAVGTLLAGVALFWSLFQLWIASPLPFMVANWIPVLNNTQSRSIHLALAIFLAYTAYPALKRSPRDRVPIQDWVFALVGAFCAGYLFLFYVELSDRPGQPTTLDLVVSGVGMVLLLEATRRALGPPLMVVALVFLCYVFFGDSSFIPEVIQWKGASFSKAMSHQWLSTEGVFGIAVGVSTSMVFLFVLFGALLEKAGAGNYFIRVAFALLGHMRGGPAKAAVVSSAMTGLISGSSIANVVTTGTFTIPLMKKVGFSAEKAGAVEVASSTNGQLTPPIMGAAAFLMVEFVGISYVEVIKHAFLPAIISYIALVYIVHLEAMKADMQGLPRRTQTTLVRGVISFLMTFLGLVILAGVVYFGFGWIKDAAGSATPYIAAALLCAAYLALLKYSTRFPELEVTTEITELPEPGPTVKAGLYYLVPLVVLVWCLTVERLSPGLAAFWATTFLLFIVLTQHAFKGVMRGEPDIAGGLRQGFQECYDGMVAGARNMIGIGVATAAAGIIVGTVTLTGIGLVMAEFVEFVSAGNLMLMLIFTAIISLILGMGLPTTANYIVVSSLMAGVVVELGAQSGLIVPLIAVHLFVFYFGIMADVTPPVGLASFAAAAVSGGDPLKTGFTAFFYSLRTVALPFLFIFNTDLLLIGVDWLGAVFVFIQAVVAMLIFAAATQGYFLTRSRIWESVALLLIAFTLFRPGFWLDRVEDPFQQIAPAQVATVIGQKTPGSTLRVVIEGPDFDDPEGPLLRKSLPLPVAEGETGEARLEAVGILPTEEGGETIIDEPFPGTWAFDELQGYDFYADRPVRIAEVKIPAERMPKEVFWIPALLLLGLIIFLQRRREKAGKPRPGEASPAAASAD